MEFLERRMVPENGSSVTEFILVGLTAEPHFPCPPFILFLVIPKSSQGFLPCGKFKFLTPPSRSRKVNIQTD
ncbi:hypothetical protein U0070_025449 [Myodes glareolus]|uniref:Uncharacterized protein n=1 Tax=Myodes glareolus TaxID=447135 RepID=A0AAW0HJG3_MYOGA